MTEKGFCTKCSLSRVRFLAPGYFSLVFKALAFSLYLPTQPGSLRPVRQLLPLRLYPAGELRELPEALCRGRSLDGAAGFGGTLGAARTIGPAMELRPHIVRSRLFLRPTAAVVTSYNLLPL